MSVNHLQALLIHEVRKKLPLFSVELLTILDFKCNKEVQDGTGQKEILTEKSEEFGKKSYFW